MTQNIKNFIEEGEKELLNIIGETTLVKDENWATKNKEDIKQFISSRQISLIKMIVEENNKAKLGKEYTGSIDFKLGYNTAIDTISSKLKELYE